MLTHYIQEFKTYCALDRDLRNRTIQQHVSNIHILNHFLNSHNKTFNENSMRDFLMEVRGVKEPGTIGGYVFTIRVLCDFMVKRGMLDNSFGKDLPMPKRLKKLPEILSVEEIELLLSTHPPRKPATADESNLLFDTLILYLATTGARINEILHAKLEDLDMVKGVWRVMDSKTRQQRYVPLSKPLIDRVSRLVVGKEPHEYVFTSIQTDRRINTPMSSESVRQELKMRAKIAGITKNVQNHIFRHSFITELLRQDISILKIAMIVGHEEIGTTQRYAKLVTEDLLSSINRHPIIAKTRNPYEIMNHIKETIKHFRLDEDKRFHYELSEGNDGIRLTLFVR